MASFTLETRSGARRDIPGKEGVTLMKLIRRAGVEELVAQCGGGCACATCHVYIETPPGGKIAAMTTGESRMLSNAAHREIASRLACQIKFDASLDGMQVRIAPEDFGAL
jgi:ferredoxin, 2Fe-2S